MSGTWGSAPGQVTPPETLEGFSGWQEIGRGGDATVYRAVQDALDRDVAIKVLMVDDEESIRRFTREVQLMVSLGRQHPNIAKVLQIGTSSRGRPCIVMDYYELGSLDQRLASYGQLSADEVVNVGTVVADALSFAHAKGVLHRDVKPQNVLILPTSYVLSDFGIARLIDSAHTSSSDRFSYRHASPQVLDGYPPSEADDIFSLGATLFHLLDGKPPFTRTDGEPDSALAYIKRVRLEEPRPLRRPDLPPMLHKIIEKTLRKNPYERFASAADLRDALTQVRTETRSWSTGDPVPRPSTPPADVTAPKPEPPMAAPGWGGTPGQAINPDDLTSLRFRQQDPSLGMPPPMGPGGAPPPISAYSPASGYTPAVPSAHSPASAVEPEKPGRKVPLLAITLGGVAIGVLLVVVLSMLNRPQQAQEATTPPPAATQPPATTPPPPASVSDPNLEPKDLKVTIEGNRATATWNRSVDTPESWGWNVGESEKAMEGGAVRDTLTPNRRTVGTDIDPNWKQVCFTVIGIKDNRYGAVFYCTPR